MGVSWFRDAFVTYGLCILLLTQLTDISGKKRKDVAERCETCRDFVKKFHEGMEKTAKDHFGGGDTAWEESRLGKYARSETRLLEILEKACEGASKKETCHAMVEEYEEEIESFWFKKQSQISELEVHLCNDVIKVCCPTGKFGEKCEECPGGSSNPCFGRGTCKGDGTRAGKGKCDCNAEYKGELCDECATNYYDAYGNLTCKECHESCEDSCTDGTNKGCDSCKEGYVDNGEGCVDKDECEDPNICEHGKFCINKKGHHVCNECDPACNGCNGTGRLSCKECSTGWKPVEGEGGCEDLDECEQGEHSCATGTYCVNEEGSFKCEQCNVACSGGCTDGTHTSCTECAPGYKISSGWITSDGCVDVNECLDLPITCPLGQTCVNKPGPDSCEPCPDNCESCVSTEPSGCLVCKIGYSKSEDSGCIDFDECTSKPCSTGEKCVNNIGSFKCLCEKGWVRTKDGNCKKKVEKVVVKKKQDTEEDKDTVNEEL